jgi:hypothetical protein
VRPQHRWQVEQRLPHAHEHNIGHTLQYNKRMSVRGEVGGREEGSVELQAHTSIQHEQQKACLWQE